MIAVSEPVSTGPERLCWADNRSTNAGTGSLIRSAQAQITATTAASAYYQKSSVCHAATLVEQIRLNPAAGCRSGQDRELDLAVLPAPEPALAQVLLAQALIGHGIVAVDAGNIQRSCEQAQEHFTRERVVTKMQILDGSRQSQHTVATV